MNMKHTSHITNKWSVPLGNRNRELALSLQPSRCIRFEAYYEFKHVQRCVRLSACTHVYGTCITHLNSLLESFTVTGRLIVKRPLYWHDISLYTDKVGVLPKVNKFHSLSRSNIWMSASLDKTVVVLQKIYWSLSIIHDEVWMPAWFVQLNSMIDWSMLYPLWRTLQLTNLWLLKTHFSSYRFTPHLSITLLSWTKFGIVHHNAGQCHIMTIIILDDGDHKCKAKHSCL